MVLIGTTLERHACVLQAKLSLVFDGQGWHGVCVAQAMDAAMTVHCSFMSQQLKQLRRGERIPLIGMSDSQWNYFGLLSGFRGLNRITKRLDSAQALQFWSATGACWASHPAEPFGWQDYNRLLHQWGLR